ncbi:MAG: zinc ABC transporter substrate-binding protein [Ruminococcus sp.]|nr:zinc ABC transporter substrate-binding protein [Ruminococcus sp.]
MKRVLCIFLCAVLACGALCGCEPYEKGSRLSIVTTSFPPYDFARAVAGDSADITMLLSPGAEAHSYEPTPLDIAKIQQCDVFVYIGGEGEVWVDRILDSLDTSDMTVICLFDYVQPLAEEEVEGASPDGHHHHDHHDGDDDDEAFDHIHDDALAAAEEDAEFDEHIWTSPRNAILCVNGVAEAMCGRTPGSAELYRANAAGYTAQLEQLDREFTEMVQSSPKDTIIVGDRFPFRYLAHDYGLRYYAAFSGCSSESEPGVYTMAFLINEILEHGIDTVFYLEFSTKKLAEKLCSATGAEMLPLYSCHNVTKADFESGVTYIDLMKTDLNNMREALN